MRLPIPLLLCCVLLACGPAPKEGPVVDTDVVDTDTDTDAGDTDVGDTDSPCTDADADGTCEANDCDDSDATRAPGLTESCDGVDNDCDGVVPSNELDADADGLRGCDNDCDDTDPNVLPGQTEVCDNGKDDDCSGLADCQDPACGAVSFCIPEDCANGVDDNANGMLDCDDTDCAIDPVCQSSFDIVVVDDSGSVGWACDLALDSANRPHISYREDNGDTDLKYAHLDGAGVWSTETVDDGIFAGSSSSIAVDLSDDRVQIAYSLFGGLEYAERIAGNWVMTEAAPYGGEHISLALDSGGQPHVVHTSSSLMKYLWRDTAGWSTGENVAGSVLGPVTYGELRLKSNDMARIGYLDTNFYSIEYAWYDGSIWSFEDVDPGQNISGAVAMALDPSGQGHLLYSTLLTSELRYAKRLSADSWQSEVVASGVGAFVFPAIEVDATARPHIAYSDSLAGTVTYGAYNGTSWVTQTLDAVGSQGGDPCLALGSDGAIHIAYQDADDHVLKYAVWRP